MTFSIYFPNDPSSAGILWPPPAKQRFSTPSLHEDNKPEHAWFYTTRVARMHSESIPKVTSDDVVHDICTRAAAELAAMREVPKFATATTMADAVGHL